MKLYPRVLVVSNNSFSKTSSNGRVLGNLFEGWPIDSLAQFCINSDGLNTDLCNNYYCITDYSALRSCLTFREANRVEFNSITKQNVIVGATGKVLKSAFNVIIRNIVWLTGLWRGVNFWNWVSEFKPDLIVVQNSDSAFIHEIANSIGKKMGVPIVYYNTEGHYFFKSGNTIGGPLDPLFYKIYRILFRYCFRKYFSSAKLVIHCNTLLKKDFDCEFSVPSEVIYISSFLTPSEHIFNETNPIFSYIGDFCGKRAPVLVEVANILNGIDSNYVLNVYGNASSYDITCFDSCPNLNYLGFVSYDKVVKAMNDSDILFHVESQDKRLYEPLKYGFSAKIADTVSMGKPFIQYSKSYIAGAQYLLETKAGWVVETRDDLREQIVNIIKNSSVREEQRKHALLAAQIYHNADSSREKFRTLLMSVVNNK